MSKRSYGSKPTRKGGQVRNPVAVARPSPAATVKRDPFEDLPIRRLDLENLSLANDALEAVAELLEYVGSRGQDGGDDGSHAAWTAVGLGSAVRIVKNQITGFCSLAQRAGESEQKEAPHA